MYKNFNELGVKDKDNVDQYNVANITDANHKKYILSNNRFVLVEVYADWCGPCKQYAADYSVLADKYNKNGICILLKEKYDLKLSSNVEGVPTFIYYLNGVEVERDVGISKDIESKIQNYLKSEFAGPQYSKSSIRNSMSYSQK